MSGKGLAILPPLRVRQAAWWIVTTISGLMIAGCAFFHPVLPPLPDDERQAVAAAYAEKMSTGCSPLEADASVRFNSLLQDAYLSGILLAKSPQSVKFIGLNPLGQPLVLFLLTGQSFLLVDVPSQKVFEGPSRSEKLTKLFPFEKLEATSLYSLLLGVPAPGLPEDAMIIGTGGGSGVYQLIWRSASGGEQIVVFNKGANLVQSYELQDEKGTTLLRMLYPEHPESECDMPTSIIVSGEGVHGRIELTFEHAELASRLTDDDFRIRLPSGYQIETVR